MAVVMLSGWRRGLSASVAASLLILIAGCKPAAQQAAGASPPAPGTPASPAAPAGVALVPVSTAGAGGPTVFEDPSEHAFSVSVPAGWTAKGGIIRKSTVAAAPWIQENSADGTIDVFYGDPSIPNFLTPSQMHAGGQTVHTQFGDEPVENYESGAQFAAGYAQQVFGQTCAGMQPTGGQPEPALAQQTGDISNQMAQEIGSTVPPPNFDGGLATFSCQVNGQPYVVGVIAVTSISQAAGLWSVPLIFGYRAPAAQAAAADQAARALQASYTRDPQWLANMVSVGRQAMQLLQRQDAAAEAAMQRMQQQDSALLNAQAQANMNRLTSEHQAFMANFNAQGAARNAAFAQQEYMKDSNTQAEIRVIKNQQCIAWNDAAHTSCRVVAPD
jgi:hypothetical protein